MTKFNVGDRVKIVNYGHIIWERTSDIGIKSIDITPEIIGQVGIIINAHKTQEIDQYSIDGIPGKTAWYNNDQLELIN